MTFAPALGARSLGTALGSRSNSLGALRLVFAACVIVSHAWWLGGYGPEPQLYGIKLGTFGVMGFFAISGYLITVSAERATTPLWYVAARFTRIYPAMAVSALLVAFLAAPLGALITRGRYSLAGAVTFLASALGLEVGTMDTPPIGTSLLGNHDRWDWDGPLWTLTWEVGCYCLVGLAVFLSRRFSSRGTGTVLGLFAAATGAVAGKLLSSGYGSNRAEFVLPLVAIFLAGALLATVRDRIPLGVLPGALCAAAAWAAYASGLGTVVAPLPFAYAVLAIGSLQRLSWVGSRYDLSYGVYLYGWPVQQLLAAARLQVHVPALVSAAVALALVWVPAFLSCILVEQPAQRLRARLAAKPLARSLP